MEEIEKQFTEVALGDGTRYDRLRVKVAQHKDLQELEAIRAAVRAALLASRSLSPSNDAEHESELERAFEFDVRSREGREKVQLHAEVDPAWLTRLQEVSDRWTMAVRDDQRACREYLTSLGASALAIPNPNPNANPNPNPNPNLGPTSTFRAVVSATRYRYVVVKFVFPDDYPLVPAALELEGPLPEEHLAKLTATARSVLEGEGEGGVGVRIGGGEAAVRTGDAKEGDGGTPG